MTDTMTLADLRKIPTEDYGVTLDKVKPKMLHEWRHSTDTPRTSWRDHGGPGGYMEHLTDQIKHNGFTEPVRIGHKEDGSQTIYDGTHRALVAHEQGIDPVPVEHFNMVKNQHYAVHIDDYAHDPDRTWYHGSPNKIKQFGDQHPSQSGDWNASLGHHFASEPETAKQFGKNIHSVKLDMQNPKVYGSEHDMDREVATHEMGEGNHYTKHLDPSFASGLRGGAAYAWKDDAKFQSGESHPSTAPDLDVHNWLHHHPDRPGITTRYKSRLMSEGHDGIVYGNEFEGQKGNASAIAFHPHQIHTPQIEKKASKSPLDMLHDLPEGWKVMSDHPTHTLVSAPPSEVRKHLSNQGFLWRSHKDLDELTDSMKQHGFDHSRPVNIHPTIGMADGHHRLEAAERADISHVPLAFHKTDASSQRQSERDSSHGADSFYSSDRKAHADEQEYQKHIQSPEYKQQVNDRQRATHQRSIDFLEGAAERLHGEGKHDLAEQAKGEAQQHRDEMSKISKETGSIIHGTHVTSKENADKIEREGFKLDQHSHIGAGNHLGRGVYVSIPDTDGENRGESLYQKQYKMRNQPHRTLNVQAEVHNPAVVDYDSFSRKGRNPTDLKQVGPTRHKAIFQNIPGFSEKYDEIHKPRQEAYHTHLKSPDFGHKESPPYPETDPSEVLKALGHDSVLFKTKNKQAPVGGSQLVVFDPNKVKVKNSSPHIARFTPDKRVFTHTCGLDHRLFDGETLRPEVRRYILSSVAKMWIGKFRGWANWSIIYFAGSEASEWTSDSLEGNNDFDVLIGVDYDKFRIANPDYVVYTNQEITDTMNQGFRAFNGPVELSVNGTLYGPFDRTTYVNPDSYDIRDIKPYAAYNVSDDKWTVKPPHLPHWGISELPRPVQAVLRACDRLVHDVLKLPEPERTQQGAALFDAWHTDRSRAFSANGEGWYDIANLREKWLDQEGTWAELVNCKHRFNEGLGVAAADWSNTPPGYKS